MNGRKARMLRRMARPAPPAAEEVLLAERIAELRVERANTLLKHDTDGRKKLDPLAEKINGKINALRLELADAYASHTTGREDLAREYDRQIEGLQASRRILRWQRREAAKGQTAA